MKKKIEDILIKIEKKLPYPTGTTLEKIERAKDLIAYNDDTEAMMRIFGELQLIYKELDPNYFKVRRYVNLKKLKK